MRICFEWPDFCEYQDTKTDLFSYVNLITESCLTLSENFLSLKDIFQPFRGTGVIS